MSPPTTADPLLIGRYALYDEIAAGGMATVHLGRLLGPVGFSRTVAIKRLHPQFAKDPEFVAMFLDEARLAARIQHPNVVPTLDVVALDHELFLVMEYVQGESLSRVVRASIKREGATPLPIVTTVMAGVLHGLHAAHEAKTEQGEALSIVHRDVSPQNVLVGIDGVPRVLDFGVAKAAHRAQTTRQGQIKGKMAYMAPEQLKSDHVDRRCDVYAAAVVLWEAVTGKRLYHADTDARLLTMILFEPAPSPRTVVPDVNAELERIIMRGLERDRDKRYATAREMALELETCLPVASASAIGGWVERMAGDALTLRARRISDIESSTSLPRLESRPLSRRLGGSRRVPRTGHAWRYPRTPGAGSSVTPRGGPRRSDHHRRPGDDDPPRRRRRRGAGLHAEQGDRGLGGGRPRAWRARRRARRGRSAPRRDQRGRGPRDDARPRRPGRQHRAAPRADRGPGASRRDARRQRGAAAGAHRERPQRRVTGSPAAAQGRRARPACARWSRSSREPGAPVGQLRHALHRRRLGVSPREARVHVRAARPRLPVTGPGSSSGRRRPGRSR